MADTRLSLTMLLLLLSMLTAANAQSLSESPREIPVVADVDVVVTGGSSAAVAAACQAARSGARVFLIAPRPYLGEDLCGSLRLWLEPDEQPRSTLALACFPHGRVATPFTVKAELDRALLDAGVGYLTGCYVTDVLRDQDDQIAGVVMANRSGRQAIRAKVIIDATARAVGARLAGAPFRPFTPGRQNFTRVVAGGEMQSGEDLSAVKHGFTFDSTSKTQTRRLPVYEYTLAIDLPDDGLQSYQRAEHRARDLTYHVQAEMGSETLSFPPANTIVGQAHLDAWGDTATVDLAAFRPQGISRLYVLSGYADLAGDAAESWKRILTRMDIGARIGQAAAREASMLPESGSAALPAITAEDGPGLDVAENLNGIRSMNCGVVHAGRRALPVLGCYDVLVVGGGTSGAPAGIGAARDGAKTLVLEYLYELGGVGTVGLIGKYWYGLPRGYTRTVDEAVNRDDKSSWNAVEKAEWLRRELLNCGADVWFGSLGCGAVTEDGKVCGVVVATPWGRGAVLAETVVDATGNADVAAWAGAPTQFGITERGALNVQIAGFPERPIGKSYVNTCYTMVDDTDVLDVWHLMVWKRTAAPSAAFDVGQLVDSRERRRVVGDYMLTVPDILNQRTFPDTISQHYSNFDAAAFPDSPLLLADDAKGPCFRTDLPYRCLLPRGLDGLLVVGLGASAERDAMTLIRMQPDLQNQGYAAGLAAAAAARLDGRTRSIDLKALQQELVRQEILDKRVLTDPDSYPLGDEVIAEAVRSISATDRERSLTAVAVITSHPQPAIPLLRIRYRELSAGDERLACAKLLGILGDATGVPTLIAAVDAHQGWDRGAALTSQRKTGNTFSDLDRLVIALGFSGDSAAQPVLLKKLRQLTPDSELSHYKAISLALRNQSTPDIVEPLVQLLDQPGFTGHATTQPVIRNHNDRENLRGKVADRYVTTADDPAANRSNLNQAYKELIVAALLFQHGDHQGRGQTILEQYMKDIHGQFARYASSVRLRPGP